LNAKMSTVLLGLAFVVLLVVSYVENAVFFSILGDVLRNQYLAVAMLFIHNLLVVSLILLGMTFYVNLVLNFLKQDKYTDVVFEHPGTFAIVFAVVILLLSILRGSDLVYGGITVEALPVILLVSAPVGIIEGYGIYLTIKKTLGRTMGMKDLVYIYGIFFMAAIVEVSFINVLVWVSTS